MLPLSSELPASLHVEQRDNILLVKLNRPAKRNAFNDELILGLERIFTQVPADVRCAVVHGEGPHFSAGLDLAALTERDAVQGLHHSRMWHRALDSVQFGPVPVVAALRGACLGGGLELASACHLRVAEASTFYALPEGQRGIFVGGGGSVRVPKLIGVARMTDMMLTGRVYQAEEGLAVGLSQYVVPEGEGLAKALELAARVATNAGFTNYAVQHVLPRIGDASPEQGLLLEALTAAIAQSAPEAKARLHEFLTGKAPRISA